MNLDPIIQAVRKAIFLCREVQHNYLIQSSKLAYEETEPVTIADYGSQAIIARAISEHYPGDAVLAEEQGQQFLELVGPQQRAIILNLLTDALDISLTQDDVVRWLDHGRGRSTPRTWVIDPIDGTKGFVAMRHYAIAAGLLQDGQPADAVIGCPGYGDGVSAYDDSGLIFFAQDGAAYQQPIGGGEATPVRVSTRTSPAELRIVQSFERQHASKERMAAVRELAGMAEAPVRELDSMEKYALVACGDADLYLRLPEIGQQRPHSSWDHAAGTALVLAAGGRVTDLDGTPLDFSQGEVLPNRGMIVSNGLIHDRVVEAVQELLRREAAG